MELKQSKRMAVYEANALLKAINIRQDRIDILTEAVKEAERRMKYADNRQIIRELLNTLSDDDNEVQDVLGAVISSVKFDIIYRYSREISKYTKEFNKLKIK